MSPISPRQFGTLKYLSSHPATLEGLGAINQGTLTSFLKRGWLERLSNRTFRLSAAGREDYKLYYNASVSERKTPGELTDYTSSLLYLARLPKRKAA